MYMGEDTSGLTGLHNYLHVCHLLCYTLPVALGVVFGTKEA